MDSFLTKICLSLLQVDNNRYAFLSGIIISLATNTFTSLCCDQVPFRDQYLLYLSIIPFVCSGIFCFLLSERTAKCQKLYLQKRELTIEQIKRKSPNWPDLDNDSLEEIEKICCEVQWRLNQYKTILIPYKKKMIRDFFGLLLSMVSGMFLLLANEIIKLTIKELESSL